MRTRSRMLLIALVCLGKLCGQAALTPSDVLNRELPKWLRFSGEYRARFEGFTAGGYRGDNDDLYLLSRLRLNMKVQPVGWLKLVAQGQDARVFWKNQVPAAPPFQDTLDLRLAYVELGGSDNKTFGLRLGRQELAFGEARLIGPSTWLNTPRAFDAVRATLRHNGYRLDAFAASMVNFRDGKFDKHIDGNNLHGLYGGLEKLVPKAVIEPYVLWRVAPGRVDFKTIGFRWAGKLPAAFDYSAEIATQTGAAGAESVSAWAGHWLAGYTLSHARSSPRLSGEYNYASGDANPADGKRETFDQLYPTAHDRYGLADQVGWRNIRHLRFGAESKPQAKWLLAASYHRWWLASARDGLYAASGVLVARSADGSAGKSVGQELDFYTTYSLSKQTQLATGYARIFPGAFLKKTTPGHAYGFPYLSLVWQF